MLLAAGIAFLVLSFASFGIDRRASHFLYDNVSSRQWHLLDSITHFAKASHWLAAAIVVLIGAHEATVHWRPSEEAAVASQCAAAFIASLAIGSMILHTIKLFFGRRRPRDDFEMGLYGFVPFSFDLQYNSFPSGHSLTITCVAVIASAVWPAWAPLWFLMAFGLAMVRALLTAHYLSDVFFGIGVGLLSAREVVIHWFPALAQPWF
ncbi:MAG TPA: phosphatase PAP2 family protein [Rhizomicrobium sp.]|nr:phosphatase PAP2 family protein [Rhizomicrobium sp.]